MLRIWKNIPLQTNKNTKSLLSLLLLLIEVFCHAGGDGVKDRNMHSAKCWQSKMVHLSIFEYQQRPSLKIWGGVWSLWCSSTLKGLMAIRQLWLQTGFIKVWLQASSVLFLEMFKDTFFLSHLSGRVLRSSLHSWLAPPRLKLHNKQEVVVVTTPVQW